MTSDRITAAHATIPDIDCQGHCRETCVAAVPMSDVERERIAAAGVQLLPLAVVLRDPVVALRSCAALTPFGRCGVHAVRPTLCRLYGTSEGLECAWGCEPRGVLLSRSEARALLDEVHDAGGDSDRRAMRIDGER